MPPSTVPATCSRPSSFRRRGPTAPTTTFYVRLNNCGEPRVENAAFLLNKLRGLRNHADYDVHLPLVRADVAKTVADADRILQTLDALVPAGRTQITDAMKLYEQQIGDVTWHP